MYARCVITGRRRYRPPVACVLSWCAAGAGCARFVRVRRSAGPRRCRLPRSTLARSTIYPDLIVIHSLTRATSIRRVCVKRIYRILHLFSLGGPSCPSAVLLGRSIQWALRSASLGGRSRPSYYLVGDLPCAVRAYYSIVYTYYS